MSQYSVQIYSDLVSIQAEESKIENKLKIFQKSNWLNTVGKDLQALICYNQKGEIVGYFAAVRTKKMGITSFHIPPFTPYFGPAIFEIDLAKSAIITTMLLSAFQKQKNIDFILPLENNDLIPYLRLGFSVEAKQTHIVDNLNGNYIQKVHQSKRRYIKKLLEEVDKGNIIVEHGENAAENLLNLHRITADRAGFKSHDKILLKLLTAQDWNDNNLLVIKEKNGKALAGAFCPNDHEYFYHLINASDRNVDALLDKANLLSTYLVVNNALTKGYKFDFEGSNIPNVSEYYRAMGGAPKITYRIRKAMSIYIHALKSFQRFHNEVKMYNVQ